MNLIMAPKDGTYPAPHSGGNLASTLKKCKVSWSPWDDPGWWNLCPKNPPGSQVKNPAKYRIKPFYRRVQWFLGWLQTTGSPSVTGITGVYLRVRMVGVLVTWWWHTAIKGERNHLLILTILILSPVLVSPKTVFSAIGWLRECHTGGTTASARSGWASCHRRHLCEHRSHGHGRSQDDGEDAREKDRCWERGLL